MHAFQEILVFVRSFIVNDPDSTVASCLRIPNEVNGKLLAIGPKESAYYWQLLAIIGHYHFGDKIDISIRINWFCVRYWVLTTRSDI